MFQCVKKIKFDCKARNNHFKSSVNSLNMSTSSSTIFFYTKFTLSFWRQTEKLLLMSLQNSQFHDFPILMTFINECDAICFPICVCQPLDNGITWTERRLFRAEGRRQRKVGNSLITITLRSLMTPRRPTSTIPLQTPTGTKERRRTRRRRRRKAGRQIGEMRK